MVIQSITWFFVKVKITIEKCASNKKGKNFLLTQGRKMKELGVMALRGGKEKARA